MIDISCVPQRGPITYCCHQEPKLQDVEFASIIKRFVGGPSVFSPLFTDRDDHVAAWPIAHSFKERH